MLRAVRHGVHEIALVEVDFVRLAREIVRGQVERGRCEVDAVVMAHLGAGERRLGQAGIATGDVEEGEGPREMIGDGIMQDASDRAVTEHVAVDELLVDRPLRLEDLERTCIEDRSLRVEIVDVDIDHVVFLAADQ